jgi:site-specific DNA-methyltransferase (adenine-specific)
LLERIITASSNPGDVVLDPFCGCGTTIHAAQKLDRQWIGIDVTYLAINLIKRRLKDAFGEDERAKKRFRQSPAFQSVGPGG